MFMLYRVDQIIEILSLKANKALQTILVWFLFNHATVDLDFWSLKRAAVSYSFPFAKICLPIQSGQIRKWVLGKQKKKKNKTTNWFPYILHCSFGWGRPLTRPIYNRPHNSRAQGSKCWLLFIISQVGNKRSAIYTVHAILVAAVVFDAFIR